MPKELTEEPIGWTVTLYRRIALCDANGAAPARHTLVLSQQPVSVPGTQPAYSEAVIDQVKVLGRKFEHA